VPGPDPDLAVDRRGGLAAAAGTVLIGAFQRDPDDLLPEVNVVLLVIAGDIPDSCHAGDRHGRMPPGGAMALLLSDHVRD